MLTGYLYGATTLALVIAYSALVLTADALLRLLLGVETDLATRQTIATGLGITVVAGPLWWLHWRWLRWQVANDAEAENWRGYRTYLLIIVALAIFTLFVSAGAGVSVFARLALGVSPESHAAWANGLPSVIALLAAAAVWRLHWQQLLQDGLLGYSPKINVQNALRVA
ncbi:MAG: DUF5671 domain-containing protein [Caldilineaceae bacterium]